MKSFAFYSLLAILSGIVFVQYASPKYIDLSIETNDKNRAALSDEVAVKKDLLALFRACQAKNYAAAAKYIVYRGPQTNRKWKDTYHYSKPTERREIEFIASDIKELLNKSDNYRFSRFSEKIESEGKWYVWEIEFNKNDQTGTVYFAFLKVKGRYLLGDIDGHVKYLRSLGQ